MVIWHIFVREACDILLVDTIHKISIGREWRKKLALGQSIIVAKGMRKLQEVLFA